MARTSTSHPLRIDTVAAGHGLIGMTFCPGKRGASVDGLGWQRDLVLDIEQIARWKPTAVVTLMEDFELDDLQVSNLGEQIERLPGASWFHLPIRDVDIPDAGFENIWVYAGHRLRSFLRNGERVLLHCRGGLGRTGTIAARLLIEFGVAPDEAIARVRQARPGAIETRAQEAYVKACRPPLHEHDFADRVLGCLVGGALGDAFGYTVEFMSYRQIVETFGPDGMIEPEFDYRGRLVATDDTQMTLFTGEAIASAQQGDYEQRRAEIVTALRDAYLRWLATQGSSDRNLYGSDRASLIDYPALWVRRAPGNTCLQALREGGSGSPEDPLNDSKGCGGVMRVAPIGLMPALTPGQCFDLGMRAAALTHGHPSGYLSAGAMAGIVRALIDGRNLQEAVEECLKLLSRHADSEETCEAINEAFAKHMASRLAPRMLTERLGEGWVGEQALAIGLQAVCSTRTFEELIAYAANHDGDSDSTASIAGQLWGAMHGTGDLPHSWIQRLDLLEPICHVAGRLLARGHAKAKEGV